MGGWSGSEVARAKPCRTALGLVGRGRPSLHHQLGLRAHHPFVAIGFGAGVGYVIALAVEADDEHGAPVAVAGGLVGGEGGSVSALGGGVADAFAEAAGGELFKAAKKIYRGVGIVRG